MTTSNQTEAASASRATDGQNVMAAIADIVPRSEKARIALAEVAPTLDISEDLKTGMQIAWQAEIHRLSLPVEYGGLSDGSPVFAYEALIQCLINICAGESSVGQMILTQALLLRVLFADSGLPKEALEQIAGRFMAGDTRLVGSGAQPGIKEPVTATIVEGGVVVNGTKQFNTQSGGEGWAYVGCVLVQADGTKKPYHALVSLDAPGVVKHHDWDNMGQRGTGSQTITYQSVFVPDGYHYAPSPAALGALAGGAWLFHGLLMQGIGEGAYDAMLGYVRTLNRPSLGVYTSIHDDLFVQRRIGVNRGNLWAARAFLLEAARMAEHATPETDMAQLTARAMASKAASVRVALQVCDDLFELCGARATAKKYRLDRFWHNARTFACHDPLDAKDIIVGAVELTDQVPVSLLPRL